MLDQHATRRIDGRAQDARAEYTTSYRANAACVRELGRLHDEIIGTLSSWRSRKAANGTDVEPPVIRRSPARCLVQLGPVALTVAWLQRAQGTVADGELLVVVWRGAVGVHKPQSFERAPQHADVSSATAVWETVLVVAADSETGWGWAAANGATGDAMSSVGLADRCVERLLAAYEDCTREQ